MNLLGNSIKFTPEGGKIRIRIDHNAAEVAVTISDNGIGISPEEWGAVFQRFYTIDKSRNGSNNGNGLGLAIVSKIVYLHQGSIEPGRCGKRGNNDYRQVARTPAIMKSLNCRSAARSSSVTEPPR